MKKAASELMLTLLLVSTLTLAFIILRAEAIDPPATEWSKIYGGAGDEEALSLVQTSDGGTP